MKIILSRKGFDTVNGGCASPYIPDSGGTLLSLPIPISPSDGKRTYSELAYKGLSYDLLLKQLNTKKEYHTCHLDPDIRADIWLKAPANWQPVFGQTGSAQGHLWKQNVGAGDLFLFFGWFRQVQQTIDGGFRFVPKAPNLHVIYGYLQVERVLTNPEDMMRYGWHPHADISMRNNKNNALYLARKTLSFDKSKPGCGVLAFSENRVLTMEDRPMGTWKEIPALLPPNLVSTRKNSANGSGVYYKGVWQEMVLRENDESETWAKSVLR